MLSIRLSRRGKKNRSAYRVVVAQKRSSRDGRALEILGFYDPSQKEKLKFNQDRLDYWLNQGAMLSPAVSKILAKKSL